MPIVVPRAATGRGSLVDRQGSSRVSENQPAPAGTGASGQRGVRAAYSPMTAQSRPIMMKKPREQGDQADRAVRRARADVRDELQA